MNSARKILLIDDDPAIAAMVGIFVASFRRGPFGFEHAPDYEAGLQRLLSGDYALCLLDYHIGKRDGLELLREAKAQRCRTPVIMLTGDCQEETDMAAMDTGAADFLDKTGLTMHALERAVCYALEMAGVMAQLQEMATRDKLTGLLNRREFDRRLQDELQRSVQFQRSLALVMLDLDQFKLVNDTHGHQVGDEVLRHVAGLLQGRVRPIDCLARYGGDEFALIMVEAGRPAAERAVGDLQAVLAATPYRVLATNQDIAVEISGGVAVWPADAPTMTALIAAADAALYAAKARRR